MDPAGGAAKLRGSARVGAYLGLIYVALCTGEVVTLPVLYRRHFELLLRLRSGH